MEELGTSQGLCQGQDWHDTPALSLALVRIVGLAMSGNALGPLKAPGKSGYAFSVKIDMTS